MGSVLRFPTARSSCSPTNTLLGLEHSLPLNFQLDCGISSRQEDKNILGFFEGELPTNGPQSSRLFSRNTDSVIFCRPLIFSDFLWLWRSVAVFFYLSPSPQQEEDKVAKGYTSYFKPLFSIIKMAMVFQRATGEALCPK